jgi:AraC family transcriptional regulator
LRIDTESSQPTSLDYIARVNRAIDHVITNLDQPLLLEDVAQVACFSPFHFHRIFRALLGETLNQFIKRLRIERALRLLSHEPHRSLTDVAFACGFTSSSDFSRSFKQRYGIPPSMFDLRTFREQRRQVWQDAIEDPATRHHLAWLPAGDNPDAFAVQMRQLPARRVAYIRVLDPYRPDVVLHAAARLETWAEERHLADGQWLGYMWDDPEIVAHHDCRYDVGLDVTDATGAEPDGEVGVFEFPAMQVAQLEVRGPIDLEVRALDWLFGTWLPSSGYVPADQPSFEAWIGRPFAHGVDHFELDIQIPVESTRV